MEFKAVLCHFFYRSATLKGIQWDEERSPLRSSTSSLTERSPQEAEVKLLSSVFVSIIPVFSCWRHRTWSLFKLQLCQTPGNCLWFHCCLCSLHRHDCSRRPLGINALSSLWCSNMWRHEGCVFTVPSFPLTTLMLQSIFLNPVRRHANIPPLRSHDVPLGATPQMVALPCEEVLTMVLIYPQNVLDHKLHLIWRVLVSVTGRRDTAACPPPVCRASEPHLTPHTHTHTRVICY